MLIRLFILLPHLLKIFVDGGYKQGVIDWAKALFGFLLEVVKRPNLPRFVVLPKRWIVERTFAWLAWHRRLSKDFEHSPKSSEGDGLHRLQLYHAQEIIPFVNRFLARLSPLDGIAQGFCQAFQDGRRDFLDMGV